MRLIPAHLRPLVKPALDPLQFAYQENIGVMPSSTCNTGLLGYWASHMDKVGSTVRITFFDFSDAFNTTLPLLLGDKLRALQMNTPLVFWIT